MLFDFYIEFGIGGQNIFILEGGGPRLSSWGGLPIMVLSICA